MNPEEKDTLYKGKLVEAHAEHKKTEEEIKKEHATEMVDMKKKT